MVGEIGQMEKVQIENLRSQAKMELSDWQKVNADRIAKTKKANCEAGNAVQVNAITPESQELSNFKMRNSSPGMSHGAHN